MVEIKLYNTLTRKKETFTPLNEKKVSLYTCGPTVYNYAHIGNMRTYVFNDILRRTMEYLGLSVKHVMNITDVGHLTSDADEGEDKMEKGARREGKTVWEVAEHYTKAFQNDLKALNILEPHIWAKVTDHIEEQIDFIKKLEEKDVTYITDDGVYFDTSKFPRYADLAKLDIEGLQEGARIRINKQKKNITDFALWKFSPKDSQRAMEWESPWGKGFPGWHIECSALALKYLGETIDIHTGAVDHIPVHHSNEIAQTETMTGKPFAQFWMHGEFLNIGDKEEKMAKSGENFITLQTIIDKGYDALTFRYLTLTVHYRSKMQFTWDSLDAAKTAFSKLRRQYHDLPDSKEKPNKEITTQFENIIADDLNMPQVIALVWDILKNPKTDDKHKKILIREFDKVLGLDLDNYQPEDIPEKTKKLAQKRLEARNNKEWNKADELRDTIEKQGYQVEDTEEGFELIKK